MPADVPQLPVAQWKATVTQYPERVREACPPGASIDFFGVSADSTAMAPLCLAEAAECVDLMGSIKSNMSHSEGLAAKHLDCLTPWWPGERQHD